LTILIAEVESPPRRASIETKQAAKPAEVEENPSKIPAIGFLLSCLYRIPAIGITRT
jgi:hypothetical protein